MVHGKLKNKIDQLVQALNGRLTNHHRYLLRLHLKQIAFLAEQIKELDDVIQKKMKPFKKESDLIQTVPGIGKTTAPAIIAEIGTDMSQFPDEAHLSSWAGICPGNNESAGVNKSGKIRKGNKYLKATLCEAAWSASKKKKVPHTALITTISPNEEARREP